MLTVILVKNVIQINNKLSKLTGDKTSNDVNFDTDISELKKFAPPPRHLLPPQLLPPLPHPPFPHSRPFTAKSAEPLRSHQRRLPQLQQVKPKN